MELSKCHCGGEAVLGEGTNRIEQRGAAEVELAALRALPNAADKQRRMKTVTDALATDRAEADKVKLRELLLEVADEPVATTKQLELAMIRLRFLRNVAFEVRCPDCGAWCWGRTAKDAGGLWNRAIQKLAELKPCCKASKDVRIDHDGMVLVRCAECDLRHLPLGTRD